MSSVEVGPAAVTSRVDPALVKALARAHRWHRMLDEGHYGSVSEMAKVEGIDRAYLGSVLRLTLLAPDIVEAILTGCEADELGLPRLMQPFPTTWAEQRARLSRPLHRATGDPV